MMFQTNINDKIKKQTKMSFRNVQKRSESSLTLIFRLISPSFREFNFESAIRRVITKDMKRAIREYHKVDITINKRHKTMTT